MSNPANFFNQPEPFLTRKVEFKIVYYVGNHPIWQHCMLFVYINIY